MANFLRKIEDIEKEIILNYGYKKESVHIDLELNTVSVDKISSYTPSNAPTINKFHNDRSKFFHRMIMGPRGSSKSVGCAHEIILSTLASAPTCLNKRQSRWLIGRDTVGELLTTTLKTIEGWFGFDQFGWRLNKQAPITATLSFFCQGIKTEIELIFISFDRPAAARKALSLELTGAYFNEASTIPNSALEEVTGSIGRFPAIAVKKEGSYYYHGIIYDTNAFSTYHPFYQRFYIDNNPSHAFYVQPGGLLEYEDKKFKPNLEAENLNNLPNGYYEQMSQGMSLEFVRTRICNKFGTYEVGKPVHPEFSEINMVNDLSIDFRFGIWLSHDFGGTNATLVAQFIEGKLFVIKELIGYKEGLIEFQKTKVMGYLRTEAKGVDIEKSIGDCADNYGHITASYSIETVEKTLNIKTQPALTNNIKARIDAVDSLILKRFGDGTSGLVISKKGCPVLCEGMMGKYCLKIQKNSTGSRIVEKPDKLTQYSHPADCLQYLALEVLEEHKMTTTTITDYRDFGLQVLG